MTGLSIDVVVRRGPFELAVDLKVSAGETLVLLGPNGSGKSTLLQTVAGLVLPEHGRVEVGGRMLTSRLPGQRARLFVLPRHRGVGLLGQDPLLFPHLSALGNVAFGRRAQGVGRRTAQRSAEQWLAAVGLEGLESRRPGQLSGGQQQRVAIARVLAAHPSVLLLDEPMAALDVQTAASVRALLKEKLAAAGIPVMLVSHNVLDAIVLADRVAVLHDGRVVEQGEVNAVLGEPANPFTRDLVGAGPASAVVDADGSVRLPLGLKPGERVWVDVVSR